MTVSITAEISWQSHLSREALGAVSLWSAAVLETLNMSRFSKVSSGVLLAFLMLLFAWSCCLTSLITADWGRSVIRLRNPSIIQQMVPKLKEKSVHVNGTSLHWGVANIHNISTRHYKNSTKINRIYVKRWFTMGYKGLWQECVNLLPFIDNKADGIPARYNVPNSSMTITYGMTTPQNLFREQEKTTTAYENGTEAVTRLAKHTAVITPKHGNVHHAVFGDTRRKDCTTIPLKKASCLLLSIRTMFSLGLVVGSACVAITLFSILADQEIREYSASHPMTHYFVRRNILSVLASAVASLSGILILMSCWWFTLDTNLSFLMPSYQDYHNKSDAFFVAGTGILVAVSSGVSYLLVAVLLGWTSLARRKEWKENRYAVVDRAANSQF